MVNDKGEMSINILVENINPGLVTNYNAFRYVALVNYCFVSCDNIIAENTIWKSVNRFDGTCDKFDSIQTILIFLRVFIHTLGGNIFHRVRPTGSQKILQLRQFNFCRKILFFLFTHISFAIKRPQQHTFRCP